MSALKPRRGPRRLENSAGFGRLDKVARIPLDSTGTRPQQMLERLSSAHESGGATTAQR